eukprot:980866-Rhodomonas_salina.1
MALFPPVPVSAENVRKEDNPNLEGNMQKIQAERGALETLLVNTAHELQAAGRGVTVRKLQLLGRGRRQRRQTNRAHACRARQVLSTRLAFCLSYRLIGYAGREKELSETVAKLKEELNEERTAFEREVLSKNDQIADLKEKLQEKKTETAIELRYLGKESKAKFNCTQRVREKVVRDLEGKIKLIEDELAIEQHANAMQAEFLQRKLAAMSDKANNMEEKSEKDLADKTKELESLKEEHENGLHRLHELEKRYNADVARRQEAAEEERRLRELHAIQRAAEERSYRAASL